MIVDADWLIVKPGEMSRDTIVGTVDRAHPALCRVRTSAIRSGRGHARQMARLGRNLTRRQFIISTAAFAALLATGCGTGDDDDDDAGSATRTVTHKFGETQVPENPQRVVSVGYDEHDTILTFGVVPIMLRDAWGDQPYGTWPWAQGALGDATPETFNTDDIPYERIVALKPDLIMATWAGIDQDTYNRLAEIAPTVAQHPDFEDWETPWDARAIQVGGVLGKEDDARAQIKAIEERIAKAKADHPEWQTMEAVTVTVEEGNFSVAMPGHSRGKLISDLGFKLPAAVVEAAGNELFAQFSIEELREIDCDLIVWVNGYEDATNIIELPLRTGLTAHKEGREVYCNMILTAAFSIQSPLSFSFLLDQLIPEIERAVDGDPATKVELAAQYGVAPE